MKNVNERETERLIDDKIKSKGWNNPEQNVFWQKPYKYQENGKSKTIKPDYAFYDNVSLSPICILEVKREGSSQSTLYKNLQKAIKVCRITNCPVALSTDGYNWLSHHLEFQRDCLHFDKPLSDLPTPEELKQLQTSYFYSPYYQGKILKSARDFVDLLKPIENELRDEGLKKGDERFTEVCKLLFLRLISQPDDPTNSWSKIIEFKKTNPEETKLKINEELAKYRTKYGIDKYGSDINITNPQTINFIVEKFNEIDFQHSDLEIKGEVFQYFLGYQGKNDDLAQYFTPRQVVSFMVSFLKPKLGENIYDPFCGSGGILVEAFDFVHRQIKHDEERKSNLKILQSSFRGQDFATIAYVAKLNMILVGDGHSNIDKCDSLEKKIINEYDLVITNIPFNGKTNHGNNYTYKSNDANSICVQHCLNALKKEKGSRAGIIVPDIFVSSKHYLELRKYIWENYDITIFSLPEGTFEPYTSGKACILFLYYRKKKASKRLTINSERERERESVSSNTTKSSKLVLLSTRKKNQLLTMISSK